MRKVRLPRNPVVVLAVLLASQPAAAFCRSTTCDGETCKTDGDECVAEGLPLFWPEGKLAVSVSAEGSLPDGITGEETEQIAREAFSKWQAATCADGLHPGLRFEFLGQVEGAVSDRIDHVNLVTFVDSNWQGDFRSVATTTVTFDATTGRITDSDTRINSAQWCIVDTGTEISSVVCDPGAGGDITHPVDLLGVLTHEAGHQLGLAHTLVSGATMEASRPDFQFQEWRTLEADDQTGICAIYPPSFAEDVAGGGWSCRTGAAYRSDARADGWALVVVVVAACTRRRCTALRGTRAKLIAGRT
jgi:hypothetical protein